MQGGFIGQYRITHMLGRGGMGVVYAAEHSLIGRRAAVKVLLPEFSQNQSMVSRFFNEAKAATAIRHPSIVEIYDFGWHTDGSAYIVMEFLEGESLSARVARGRIPWQAGFAVIRQIAGALSAAHSKGIVHRDLKPDNVFIVADSEVPGGERIKLLDFGIAKLAGDQLSENKTRTGAVMGTPTYMAPEQCRGVPIDHRADLYSLGVILFELCTGRPPFVGEGSGDVLAAHIHLQPPTVSSLAADIPPAVDLLVHQLLTKSPTDRIQTAEQLIRLVDSSRGTVGTGELGLVSRSSSPVIDPSSTPTTLSGAASQVSKPSSGRRTIVIAALAAGAIGAAILALTLGGGSRSAPAEGAPERLEHVAQPAPEAPPAVETKPVAAATETAPPTPPAPVATPPENPPPVAATIDVAIASTPVGAEVLLGGKRLGITPFHGTLPKQDDEVKLIVRKAGHKDSVITVRANAPIDQTVKLEAKPRSTTTRTNRDQSVNPFGD